MKDQGQIHRCYHRHHLISQMEVQIALTKNKLHHPYQRLMIYERRHYLCSKINSNVNEFIL